MQEQNKFRQLGGAKVSKLTEMWALFSSVAQDCKNSIAVTERFSQLGKRWGGPENIVECRTQAEYDEHKR